MQLKSERTVTVAVANKSIAVQLAYMGGGRGRKELQFPMNVGKITKLEYIFE